MAFQVNTNINALTAHVQSTFTQFNLKNSMEKLSSGLRINKASDDASGMTIADSLRSQASALGQAIRNTNDAMGIIQIADKAMDEQIKILDSVKTKAVQAAQDGQSETSRGMIQMDIRRLIEGLDNIGNNTTYNGMALLSGMFSNKEFQIGAYSNQSVKTSIGAAVSNKIGQVRIETGAIVTSSGDVLVKFINPDGRNDMVLESVKVSHSAGTGLGVLAEVINKNSDKTGIRAHATAISTSDNAIASGSLAGILLNGVTIGDVIGIKKNDSDGRLVNAINSVTMNTGVEAYTDMSGRLNLRSVDGRGISFKSTGAVNKKGEMAVETLNGGHKVKNGATNYGRLSMIRTDTRDVIVSGINISATGYKDDSKVAQTTANLRDVTGIFNADVKSAAGSNFNVVYAQDVPEMGAGVTTLRGAMVTMDIAQSAQQMLDKVRADLGSVQGQLISTLNNISVTQVNVKAAESNIREVDFAAESSEFGKLNILAQSGSYTLSQANVLQQNILRLLN